MPGSDIRGTVETIFFIVIIMAGFSAIASLRRNGAKFSFRARRFGIYFATSAFILMSGSASLFICYANLSALLKSALSASTIESLRTYVHLLFDVDSVFLAVQTVFFSSLMFSFVSCAAVAFGWGAPILFCTFFKTERTGKTDCEEREVAVSYPVFIGNSFLSKFNC